MSMYGGPWRRLVRPYAICASLLSAALLPAALLHIGTTREAPFALPFAPAGDGTLHVRRGHDMMVVERVSVSGGAPVAAGSVTFLRHAQSLPDGTTLRFLGRSLDWSETIRRTAASPAQTLQQIVTILLTAVFALTGLAVAISSTDSRANTAAAALSGTALLFASLLLPSTMSVVRDSYWNAALLVLWQSFPRPLGLYWLPRFAASFPQPLEFRERLLRILLGGTLIASWTLTILDSAVQIPGALDQLPLSTQRTLILITLAVQYATFALSLPAVCLAVRAQWRHRSRAARTDDDLRLKVVTNAVLVGLGAPMALGVLQLVTVFTAHRTLIPSPLMVAALGTMLVIPPAIAYAARARRVQSIRILLRRAVLFTLTRGAARAVSVLPVVILATLLYRHRTESVALLAAEHPWLIGLSVAATLLSLRFAETLHVRVEELFFRDRVDARRILKSLAEAAARADRIDDLSHLIEVEIDRALHLESVSLFMRELAGERFHARGVPWFLEPFSAVVDRVTHGQRCVELEAGSLDDASEMEVLWLTEASVRMAVPLRGGTGALIGFVALGEKRNELPFDGEDRALLEAIAASASLAVENQILRSSPRASPTEPHFEGPDPQTARYCPSCRRVSETDARLCLEDGTALVDVDVPLIIAGKYRLDHYVGAGGMGIVFRAHDLTLGRAVAIKTLPHVSTEAAARFRRESRLGASTTHSALAAVYAAETWRGRPLLVMEYLARGTLARRIDEGPLSFAEVSTCGVRIGDALSALHASGVLHRDVKPSNIGFASDGSPKLLDFGLARLLADSNVLAPAPIDDLNPHDSHSTDSTGIMGTPAYLPPETIVGRHYGPVVDLWGFAMSLYEAVTGTHPFRASNPLRMMNRIVSEAVPDPRTFRNDCPAAIAALLNASLARDPRLRPADAAAVANAWREISASESRR